MTAAGITASRTTRAAADGAAQHSWGSAQWRHPQLRSQVLHAEVGPKAEIRGRTANLTEKSAQILEWVILSLSSSGDTVYDMFGGSGASIPVCLRLARNLMIFEQDGVQAGNYEHRLAATQSALQTAITTPYHLPRDAIEVANVAALPDHVGCADDYVLKPRSALLNKPSTALRNLTVCFCLVLNTYL